jgi:pantetheine-phosphate adenylyltransferase
MFLYLWQVNLFNMQKIAVFPGSFDPVTKGHQSIVLRALPIFDKIVVAIGINSQKKNLFSLDQRKKWLKQAFQGHSKIEIQTYEGLTINFCKKVKANFILRGLRNPADFEFERNISQMNKVMESEIETVFLVTCPEYSAINSTIVRDIISNKGNAKPFVPNEIDLDEV